jgi:hypothetical protein
MRDNVKYLLFMAMLLMIFTLTSCFKTVPVDLLNTDDLSVSLNTDYDFYSKQYASAMEVEFDSYIPKEAFIYDENNSVMLIRNFNNKTVVLFSKAQRNFTKGEKLFSIKRKYLNP